ncbi:DNA polymerase IV [Cyclobacterium sp. 1_MG-2023]|uniref:DNA polymerase IV n=1 Tax=Cyclobacterium sp. 1_MG-2023 TaxID=3062681 RepID=UPI0026E3707F|nr:DNA polymerase IV [Cyclobacterium sp. 1_MG-2023]MDO6438475.1 DNA polymerase IV [Cyclobacterium sp. 1_MG-2023]
MENYRKIIHVDMDAFFASVEQLDHPEYKNKPLAVGGNKERGVVAAASYEARKFGVRSAMSSKLAAIKCPNLIFVKPRFERYKEISLIIRKIFLSYTDLVEPLSLDEAFLDVTTNYLGLPSATLIARDIRKKIKAQTGLNASAGISYNKFLAKIASDLNKPNGQAVITPAEAEAFLEKLPIEKFYGIGKVMAKKMNGFGIYNGYDLKQYSLPFLTGRFGKSGLHFYKIVRGIHESEVKPDRIRKSIGVERTFDKDLSAIQAIEATLEENILPEFLRRLERNQAKGRTITIKIKYNDFSLHTRSKTQVAPVSNENMEEIALDLLHQEPLNLPIRLLGISLSNLISDDLDKPSGEQLKFDY